MKLAIDIAILPPDHITDLCIDIGKDCKQDITVPLNKQDNLPHITLVMGVMDEDDLNRITNKSQTILDKFKPLHLSLVELNSVQTNLDKLSYGFKVDRTQELVKLHQVIMDEFLDYLSKEKSNQEMFYIKDGEEFSNISMRWVDTLYRDKKPDDYFPHISLKCQSPMYNNLPVNFIADRIAVCQLGDHCTCRKILWESKLGI
jgi:hypothetical protein